MPSRNIHEICGHLGGNQELDSTQSGRVFCRFSVATNNGYYKDGRWVEAEPSWHNIIIWGDLARAVADQFAKGDAIMVRGRSHTRKFMHQGGMGQTTEVVAHEVYKPIYVKKSTAASSDDLDFPFGGGEYDG